MYVGVTKVACAYAEEVQLKRRLQRRMKLLTWLHVETSRLIGTENT